MRVGGIYEILNTANGKRYIGSAVDIIRRLGRHRIDLTNGTHHNTPLQRAWNKYGANLFQMRPIMLVGSEGLLQWEQHYLDEFKPEYNIAATSSAPMLGRHHTDEARAKISAAGRGNSHAKGYRYSVEARAQMSISRTGIKKKPHTAQTKAKISAAKLGVSLPPFSAVHKAKISKSLRARAAL